MKSIFTVLLFFLFTNIIHAQIVNIPDANFKSTLLSYYDFNNDGEIQLSEIENVTELFLYNDNISNVSGIEYFTNLEYLDARNNSIQSIDLTQNVNLETILIKDNSLDSLDLSQNLNLENLDCRNNNLTTLDLSANLNLLKIRCSNNYLSTLDVSLNSQLDVIECDNNDMSDLILGDHPNLVNLWCINNQLSEFDVSLYPNLRSFECSNNNLSEIDITQNLQLVSLVISNNSIQSVDLNNNHELELFRASDNLLTQVDLSNTKVIALDVDNNQISFINLKNGADSGEGYTLIANNPIEYICADEFEVFHLQTLNSQVPISSYCSFEPGGEYNTISGNIIFDIDDDGCDVSDISYPLLRLDITDGTSNGITFSNSSGEYVFYTYEGNFEITPNLENSSWFNISPENVDIPFTDFTNTEMQDFCITPIGTHNDLEIVILPSIPAEPGFDAAYQIVYKNKGNQTLSGEINFSFDDDVLDLVSTSISPVVQSTGNLTWNYTNLNPFESQTIDVVLNVNSPMETPAINIGDVLEFSASISPITGDETELDNTFDYNQVVVGSFDPNDITCLEGDIVSPERIGEYLHYNIRFENTGTAAATFIVVKDVIDTSMFDLTTLQILHHSHDMVTRIEDNELEFFFEDINLVPDGQGNVVFKIKSLSTLVTGDSVAQQAEIFFDFNFPIETNVANTTFQNLSVEETQLDMSISIVPNPTTGMITVNTPSRINSLNLFDVQGRQVQNVSISEANTINISKVSKGIYFLEIHADLGTTVKKIIKN